MPGPLDIDPQTHIFECRAQDYLNALDLDLENRAEPKEAQHRFVVRCPEEWNRLPLDLKDQVRNDVLSSTRDCITYRTNRVHLSPSR
jgi:hypothetical protein